MDLSFSEQLLRVFFSTFCGQKKTTFLQNILASALKSCIISLLHNFFFELKKKNRTKINLSDSLNRDCKRESGFIQHWFISDNNSFPLFCPPSLQQYLYGDKIRQIFAKLLQRVNRFKGNFEKKWNNAKLTKKGPTFFINDFLKSNIINKLSVKTIDSSFETVHFNQKFINFVSAELKTPQSIFPYPTLYMGLKSKKIT